MLFLSLPAPRRGRLRVRTAPEARPTGIDKEDADSRGVSSSFTINVEEIVCLRPRSYGTEILLKNGRMFDTSLPERDVILRIAEYSIAVWIDVDGHAFPSRPVAMK